MNKTIKLILLIVGVALIGYGIYTLIAEKGTDKSNALTLEVI